MILHSTSECDWLFRDVSDLKIFSCPLALSGQYSTYTSAGTVVSTSIRIFSSLLLCSPIWTSFTIFPPLLPQPAQPNKMSNEEQHCTQCFLIAAIEKLTALI